MSIVCTSEAYKQLVAYKKQLERRMTILDDEDEEMCELFLEVQDIEDEINEELGRWRRENKDKLPRREEIRPATNVDELHFFRFGKIDCLEESRDKMFNGIGHTLECGSAIRVLECYNELPEDLRLSAVDLLAWGEKNIRNTELPTLEDILAWFNYKLHPEKQLVCKLITAEYIKQFGDRFVVSGKLRNELLNGTTAK